MSDSESVEYEGSHLYTDDNVIIELDDDLYEIIEIIGIEGFTKVETYISGEINTMETIDEFKKCCMKNICNKAYSMHTYETYIGSKYVALTYMAKYKDVDRTNYYIELSIDAGRVLFNLKHDEKAIRKIYDLCNNYIIDAARSRTKSARN